MSKNYKEAFSKTRLAGSIAAGALDEVAKIALYKASAKLPIKTKFIRR